jgi:hypothetical protein
MLASFLGAMACEEQVPQTYSQMKVQQEETYLAYPRPNEQLEVMQNLHPTREDSLPWNANLLLEQTPMKSQMPR